MTNNLNDLFPNLIKEWNYEKNGKLNPSELSSGSHFNVWWKCEKGHEWKAEIKSRTHGENCPYCSNKKVLKGYNDLATTNPDLLKEWNYEKNQTLPYEVTSGSSKKVWWKCKNNHEWYATISNRKNGSICPYCSNKKILNGYNDLATTNPELAKEWNYEKNEDLKPEDVFAGSEKKVWWKCEKGHEWMASIKNRNKGSECPFCTNHKLLKGYNDLATTNPELAKEWNYEKNGDLKPEDIIAGSNLIIWWKCEKGHEWKTKSLYRSLGECCPICSNHQILKGYNDLATLNPKLLKEWDFEKNNIKPNEVGTGSVLKVWWVCKKGHSFKSAINMRTSGTGCPLCSKELKTSLPERIVYFYIKKYFDDALNNYYSLLLEKKELDIYIPSIKTAIEYDGERFHNYQKDIFKDNLCKKNNITLYRIREKNCKKYKSDSIKIYLKNNNLISLANSIKELLTYLKVTNFDVNIDRDLSEIYNIIDYLDKENSIVNKNPNLIKEWNYEKNGKLNPSELSSGSHFNVWWKCEKGHEWKAEIKSRCNGRKCPYCTNNKLLKGYNDLATTNPELVKEWNYEKNGNLKPEDVFAGSEKKVWWKCENGHEWKTSIKTRKRGSGCLICLNNKRSLREKNYTKHKNY